MKTQIHPTTFKNLIHPKRKKRRNIVTVHLGNKVLLLEAKEITYLQGDGNYTFVHTTTGKRYLVSKTMKTILALLNAKFLRIHKSHTINPEHLVARIDAGNVLLSSGQQLPIARRRIPEMQEILAGEYRNIG